MSIFEIKNKEIIEKLFEGWEETLILSVLQGCMGQAYVDDIKNPKSAKLVIADFCFLAGEVNEELIFNGPKSDFIIMVPQNENWSAVIEKGYKEKAKRVKRYATKKEHNIFDIEKLKGIYEGINKTINIQMIDKEIFDQVLSCQWSKDLCAQFKGYETYKKQGIGVVAVKDGVVIAGASSYTVYNDGIEIEIDTREDYRRRGLALACGAKLIVECINRGLYPSWDAQNKGSLKLAEKLGYNFDKEYTAYEVYLE